MPLARAGPVLLCMLYLATAPAAAAPDGSVIEKLIGSWEGEGELFGRPATFSMRWSWTLLHRFVELRFENRLVHEDGSAPMILEAFALYRVSDGDRTGEAGLSGTWYDTRGQVVELNATATAEVLSTRWIAESEEGRTTYRVIDADMLEVEDRVWANGEWRLFGSATYRRSSEHSVAGQARPWAAGPRRPPEGSRNAMQANGRFEVTLNPMETYNESADADVGRMSIDKTFEGDLVATSQGEMLSGGSPVAGSAGYVAIERVTGALHGRAGSFLLQHSGSMTPTSQELTITVIPGSGSGELEGIAGTMGIEIVDGQHFYELEYTLPSD